MELIQIDRKTKNIGQLEIGKFSKPSKMPCFSWSISAKKCKTGSRLARIVGSVCHHCYALKHAYNWPSTVNAMERRLKAYDSKKFVANFVLALQGERFFRWFDSGDIQNLRMLEDIAEIAKQTPNVAHWLPTKEAGFVRAYLKKHGAFPSNLTVRISAYFVDQLEHSQLTGNGSVVLSEIKPGSLPSGTVFCNAPNQNGKCLDCRACWNKGIPTIAYLEH